MLQTLTKRRPHLVAGLLLAACGIAASYLFFQRTSGSFSEKRGEKYWIATIGQRGSSEAYEEFMMYAGRLEPKRQHEEGHAFGGALFETLGVDGLSVCDDHFNYACNHEFLGRAIGILGVNSVRSLNEKCAERGSEYVPSCRHGTGHGLVTYLGYTIESLQKSLSVCDTLSPSTGFNDCYHGAFMEYALQSMLGEDGKTRPLPDTEPYALCDRFNGAQKSACIFLQPRWLSRALWEAGTLDAADRFRRIGSECEKLEVQAMIQVCFEGAGDIAPVEAAYRPEDAYGFCEASSQAEENRRHCTLWARNKIESNTYLQEKD